MDCFSARVVHVVDLQRTLAGIPLFRPRDTGLKRLDMSRLARSRLRCAVIVSCRPEETQTSRIANLHRGPSPKLVPLTVSLYRLNDGQVGRPALAWCACSRLPAMVESSELVAGTLAIVSA